MAKYDLYPAPIGAGYLLDVQADLLAGLDTRLVVPVLPETAAPEPAKLLNPVFEFPGGRHVMVTQYVSTVPARLLGHPSRSLAARAGEIARALEVLLKGV